MHGTASSLITSNYKVLMWKLYRPTLSVWQHHYLICFTMHIGCRLDRCGYLWPSVEVCYCDLSVIRAAIPVEDSLPSLTAPLTRLFKKSKTRSTVNALTSATGVLK